jgi:hypothetical protein
MWFLIIQIFLLMLVAAVLGAGLGHWWTRRRLEDVTEAHEELRQQAALGRMATRDDMRSEIATLRGEMVTLSSGVNALKMPDLDPVQDRLARVEQAIAHIRFPEPNLQPVHARLTSVENALLQLGQMVKPLQNTDLSPVEGRFAGLEGKLNGLDEKIAGVAETVRSWKAPDVDLGPVHSGILSLQLALDRMKDPTANLEMIELQVAQLEKSVAAIHVPEPDLAPVMSALAEVDRSLSSFERKPVDLEPLHERIGGVEGAFAPIERRLAGLQEALGRMPEPDMAPVLNAVHSIDSRADLVAVENRITAIEYSLAALHHMLRSRTDGVARDGQNWQPRVQPQRESRNAPIVVRPPRDLDPINPVRRDIEANLLLEPAFGPADDLELIEGVGPMLASLLHEIGVYYFWQVAEWSPEEVAFVDSKLMHFRGRIRRDDWVGHARQLAGQPTAARRPASSAR